MKEEGFRESGLERGVVSHQGFIVYSGTADLRPPPAIRPHFLKSVLISLSAHLLPMPTSCSEVLYFTLMAAFQEGFYCITILDTSSGLSS